MKTKLIFLFLCSSFICFAQNGINYKAVIKDNLGNMVANSTIDVLFAILEGAGQTNVYQETHSPTTDANGIIIVNIGEGTQVFGNYSTIDWGSDEHFLYVSIDIGNGWIDMGTTEFKAVPYALHALNADSATGLEAIDEGHGIGWRLKGQNPNNYGIVGFEAKDLSFSTSASTTRGATGDYAIALGFDTTASSAVSLASGSDSKATGLYSTAIGYFAEASGEKSISMGTGTIASGTSSIALGRYNIANSNALLSLGNGTDISNRADALTVLNNGNVGIGINSPNNLLHLNSSTILSAIQFTTTATGSNSTDGLFLGYSNGSNYLWNYENSNLIFGTNNLTRMSIKNDGKVGLGTTAPTDILHVNNATSGSAMMRFSNSTTGATVNDGLWLGVNYTGNNSIWSFENNDIAFGTNNATRMLIKANGNIGIGISEPNEKLHIYGESGSLSMMRFSNISSGSGATDGLTFGIGISGSDYIWNYENSDIYFGTNNAARMLIKNNGNVGFGKFTDINGRVEIASASALTSPQLYIHENTANGYARLNFSNANRTDYWAIGAYIGTTSSADRFNFFNSAVGADIMSLEGSGNVRVNGAIVHASDKRLKKDITDLSYGLKEVLQLEPKAYHWKAKPDQKDKSLGLIAQDVQKIIKEIVHTDTDEEKTLSISYTELIPVLIKAIQEQQEIIDKQSENITKQDSKINTLTAELDQLKTLDTRVKQIESLLKTANQ